MNLPNLRIGFAGYGGFARFLHHSWSTLDGVKVVAAASLGEMPPDIRASRSWEEMIDDDNVDLVAVTTPPDLHATIAEAAMKAGKHVLIEKPLATSLDEARRLIKVRDRTKRIATVDFMMRFTPIVEVLARWRSEHPFGRLRRVVVENHALDETLPPQHWFWDRAQSGGILVEHAVHFFDLVSSLTDGKPGRITGWSHRRPGGQEDRIMATVSYDDGLAATQYHTFSRPTFFERTTIRLWFDLAEIETLGWFPLRGKVYALTNRETHPALSVLPNFNETVCRAVPNPNDGANRQILMSGEQFVVSHEVEGEFDVKTPKMEVYANAVRALLDDMRTAIANPGHKLRVTLENGAEALSLALQATEDADAHARR